MIALRKIKVLFRHRSMEMGGVEKVMLSVLKNLDAEKFELTVCLNLNQGALRHAFPAHVKKVFLTDGKEDFSKNILLHKIQLLKRKNKLNKFRLHPELIDKNYLKEDFDIEIAMTYNDFESVLNSTNKKSKKIGWFHSEIDLPKLQPLVPAILKQFPEFDQVIYCSEKIQEIMHHVYPELNFPQESVIINAIPIDEIKKMATEKIFDLPESPVFVSVGRLHSRKGFHKLMNVHAKLLAEGFQHCVMIIGDGEELKNLRTQQKHLRVEKTFILAGNKMNPYPYVKNADFFIMPSESEAWPLVIAEALILQKPIIATKVGDVEKMIKNGETGNLIDYKTDEIYSAMKEFLTDKPLVEKIEMNLKNIEDQFDNQLIFQKLETLLLNLYQSKNC